jgi:hypothetical protein
MKIGVWTGPWSVWNEAARALDPEAVFSRVKLRRDMAAVAKREGEE